MYAFDYHRPKNLAEAHAIAADRPDAHYLAGGQTLVQAMRLRLAAPSDLIDLGDLEELQGLAISDDRLRIGAMTRHAEVAGSALVRQNIPALSLLAGMIGDRQVRNLGTLGGSVANNDPAADYPAAVLGLGATVQTERRQITADAFFTGLYETALAAGEVITAISFPIPTRAAYMKFRNPASRFAIVGVFVADFGGNVRVAVTGAGPYVFRQRDMEEALTESFHPSSVERIRVAPHALSTDLHASPEYRAHLIGVMARRAIELAAA